MTKQKAAQLTFEELMSILEEEAENDSGDAKELDFNDPIE
jgi:hypothetical protein